MVQITITAVLGFAMFAGGVMIGAPDVATMGGLLLLLAAGIAWDMEATR